MPHDNVTDGECICRFEIARERLYQMSRELRARLDTLSARIEKRAGKLADTKQGYRLGIPFAAQVRQECDFVKSRKCHDLNVR